jgi:GH24 family phage-related lysozyme (muramidase)
VGLINAGRIAEGCKALAWAPDGKTPVWAFVTNAQGKKEFVRGLHARRLAEADLCKAGL